MKKLESLLRIVRKRVSADRTLINVFNSYNNTKPDGFQICEVNPIVAKLIVVFQNAYSHLTSLIPIRDDSSSDNNCDINDNDDNDIDEGNCNDDTVTDESLMDNKASLSDGSSICVRH
uniref:Uncharacterized protein n=1 Tax=Panagrolaimus superbus TaxID=310955 RepID=A0A914YS40_9BILA